MLEKMDIFFENRLAGYDEHMLADIEGANEFYKFTALILKYPLKVKNILPRYPLNPFTTLRKSKKDRFTESYRKR